MKAKQEKITKEFAIVVEKINKETNKDIDYNQLITNFKIIADFYAIILHDKDTKVNENNEIENIRPHYHIIIKLKKRSRKMTLLNHLGKFNNLPLEMIQIDYLDNMELMIRYLIHLDNKDKYQYAPFLINSNNEYYINEIINLNTTPNDINAQLIIHYIYTMRYSLTKILEKIGLKNFNKYSRTINTIYNEFLQNAYRYEYDKNKERNAENEN